jgi:hypothetical protein
MNNEAAVSHTLGIRGCNNYFAPSLLALAPAPAC